MLYSNEQAKVEAEKSEVKKKSRKFRVPQYVSIVAAFWLNFNWFSRSLFFYPFWSTDQHRTDKSKEKKERHKKLDLHLLSVRMVDVVLWFSTRKCSTWTNQLVNFVRRWMNWRMEYMCEKRNKFLCAGHCLSFLRSIRLLVCFFFFILFDLPLSLSLFPFIL